MKKRASRLWRHFVTDRADVHRAFPAEALERIERAIAEGETQHAGQVRFAVEAALPLTQVWRRMSARHRALEVFGLLRVWDTDANNGVLVYLLLADRNVQIVADRGIHDRVGDAAWEGICRGMTTAFRAGNFAEGGEHGIAEISALLAVHWPRTSPGTNELPDKPVVL